MSQIALEYSLRFKNSTSYFDLWVQRLIAQRAFESVCERFLKPEILKEHSTVVYIEERRMLVYKCWPEGGACEHRPVSFDKAGKWGLTCWHPLNSSSDYLRLFVHSGRVLVAPQSMYR